MGAIGALRDSFAASAVAAVRSADRSPPVRWAVPAFYATLAVLATWPLALTATSALPGLGDALLHVWILEWNARALLTEPSAVWNAPIFYPYPDALAFSDNDLVLSLVAAPLPLSALPLRAVPRAIGLGHG